MSEVHGQTRAPAQPRGPKTGSFAEAAPTGADVASPPAARAAAQRARALRLAVWGAPLVLFILLAVFGPQVVPYDAISTNTGERLRPPGSVLASGATAWLGTDQVGRDLLAQVFQGARISLLVGGATVLAAGVTGLIAGVVAGYYGGAVDTLLMRLADIQLGFPTILLAILIASVLGPSVANVIITLAITRWVVFARMARASTLSTKELDYVLAARTLGAGDVRLLLRHVIPAIITPLIIVATVEVGLVIIGEASLSFLGLGTPSSQPSWGLTVANGRAYLDTAWWISTMPGLALSLMILAAGVFGDRLRDYLNPRAVR